MVDGSLLSFFFIVVQRKLLMKQKQTMIGNFCVMYYLLIIMEIEVYLISVSALGK